MKLFLYRTRYVTTAVRKGLKFLLEEENVSSCVLDFATKFNYRILSVLSSGLSLPVLHRQLSRPLIAYLPVACRNMEIFLGNTSSLGSYVACDVIENASTFSAPRSKYYFLSFNTIKDK